VGSSIGAISQVLGCVAPMRFSKCPSMVVLLLLSLASIVSCEADLKEDSGIADKIRRITSPVFQLVASTVLGSLKYVLIILFFVVVARVVLSMVRFLGKDEQLRIVGFTETTVRNGPAIVQLYPGTYRSATVQKAESLGTVDYIKVKDTVGGGERIERGPKLLFLGAYDAVTSRGSGITLSKTEYLVVEDQLTGQSQTVKGPQVWFPKAHDSFSAKRMAIALQEDEYIRIADTSSGVREIRKGKDLIFLEPTQKVEGGVRKALTLKANEFVRLLDNISGKITVHKGESTVFPNANEELVDGNKIEAIELKIDEYVKIIDQTSGEMRVVGGPNLVFLGPNDKVLENGKKKAIQVDDEKAVLVRELTTGQLRLVTENQLFVPGPNESIEEVRELVMLADHEAMILKDKDGHLHFKYGDPSKTEANSSRSFFVPPHSEVMELMWSGGTRRAKRDLRISRLDLRPQFMWNEIDCRTKDNVELVLETTLFWEVTDLAKLVRKTGNLTGDIYNQIRSQFIKHAAQVTLKEFMGALHQISHKIFDEDKEFYNSRGVQVHSLEVTRYSCAEKRTSEVLQQIIEETTNRLNRLSQAESENEVKIFKMEGQIAQEKLNGDLLEIQHAHQTSEASVYGEAEAERIAAFVQGLDKVVPRLEDRLRMWQTLRKTDALSTVAQGGASLYYTPSDVNLSIKTDGS
jgi:regulator of protease activity HflC (stomatin/prohibitin superfamily)